MTEQDILSTWARQLVENSSSGEPVPRILKATSEEALLIHRPGRKSDLVAALTDSSALIGRSCPVRGPANWMLGAGIILPWIGESSNCNLHRACQAASVSHNYNAA